MYNIYSHNENVLNLVKSIITHCSLAYLHPFGATQRENVEIIGGNDNGPIVIIYDQEPLDLFYNKTLFNYILTSHRDLSGELRPMILLNTERDSVEKEKILKHYNAIDVNYFFHALCASDWYRGYRYNINITPIVERKLTKKFITFNRITGASRLYRSMLISKLSQKNILDAGYVSYSPICPVHGTHFSNSFNNEGIKYGITLQESKEYIENLKKVNHPLRIDSSEEYIPNGSYDIGPLPELMSSFLHVVTETMFWDERTHLTEKIFKPIVAKQPFVLVGCANNLEYLKSYGFKTFDRWWDESYDSIKNPHQRLNAVVDVIDKICKMSFNELQDMLKEMQEVLEYNYNWFYSIDFLDTVWAELKTNFSKITEGLSNWTPPNILPNPQIPRDVIVAIRTRTKTEEEANELIAKWGNYWDNMTREESLDSVDEVLSQIFPET